MQTFLVGGAVRDSFLGRKIADHDYVVVGTTPSYLLSKGFKQVGADFPVFLHPETGEEYALARTEVKEGEGYNGFSCDFGPSVTLEEDLSRRDLTVNAMAMAEDDSLFDPFNGLSDIRNHVLRHTTEAFADDPVRVLRLARFRARFGNDWSVAPETRLLVRQMGKSGLLDELTTERVWKELSRALMETEPRLFFDTLLECDVLHVLFPEVYKLKTALESMQWHPEGNAYEHTMLVVTQAAKNGFYTCDQDKLETVLAALVHDFGKGLTPRSKFPAHHGHDVKGVALVELFCERFNLNHTLTRRLKSVTRYHMNMHRLSDMNAKTVVKMFDAMDAKRDKEVVYLLYRLGCCDQRGRLGSENEDVTRNTLLLTMFAAYDSVTFADVFPAGETNVNKITQGLYAARRHAVSRM